MIEGIINIGGFSARDLDGMDRWETFTPVFGSLTVVGATNYTGRLRIVGRSVMFQVRFSAATSVASTAGTDYLNLPIAANPGGLAGFASMQNSTTNVAAGNCAIDVTNSRAYLPAIAATPNVFRLFGMYEI